MAINISNHKQEKNHNSSEKLSYEGKKVFVGIDVHKRTSKRRDGGRGNGGEEMAHSSQS